MNSMREICYKKNFLKEVIARIDFAQVPKVLAGVVLSEEIQKEIRSRYKIYEPNTAKLQDIKISDAGVTTNSEDLQQWIYHGENREKSITIHRNSIVVSVKHYEKYEEFMLDAIQPIKKIAELEGNLYINRTGLRFVNIFEGQAAEYTDVSRYFHPMISKSFDHIHDPEHCSRNFLITEYLHDETKLRIQSGMFNPDYPAKIKKKDFIVDLDAYVDTPHTVADVESLFSNLHSIIQKTFEACITDNMRRVLNNE